MKTIKLMLLSSVLLYTSVQAQAEGESSGFWLGAFPVYQVSPSQTLSLQAEFRRQGPQSFGLFRPSYHWKQSPHFVIGGGYDYFALNRPEHRLWPEVSGVFQLLDLKGVFDWRFRQEIRLKEGQSRTGSRSRILLGWHRDLTSKVDLRLYLFDELFWQQCGFQECISAYDRNWLGVRVRVEVDGYYYDIGGFWESISADQTSGLVATFSTGHDF